MSKNNKIIEFPKVNQLPRNDELTVASVDATYSKILMGDWTYSCPNCNTKISFTSNGMIFRIIETFCGSCGHLHRIVNPAFSSATPKYKLK
ncbi:MAG: lysine biosynthesis protein [Caudoviricetes sp.]|nr:MAG: lysine biosynthesis protein [Caudoviricetes sp.]